MQINSSSLLLAKIKEFIHYTAWGGMVFLLLYLAIGYLGYSGYGIGFNASDSERTGFYYTKPRLSALNRNDIYAFQLSHDHEALADKVVEKDTYLLKQVGAVSGEYLFTHSNTIYACKRNHFNGQCRKLGTCLNVSFKGHKLHCQHWDGDKIPENHYYMMSTRVKDSYDSRYFGLINGNQIKRTAHLIHFIGG